MHTDVLNLLPENSVIQHNPPTLFAANQNMESQHQNISTFNEPMELDPPIIVPETQNMELKYNTIEILVSTVPLYTKKL